jgi:hypothetical protein
VVVRAFSRRIQLLWDRGAAHIGRHPRTYTVVGGVLMFVPTDEVGRWIWKSLPSWSTAIATFLAQPRAWLDSISLWNLAGVFLLLLVWFKARKARLASKEDEANPIVLTTGQILHAAAWGAPRETPTIAATVAPAAPIAVRATQMGFYGNVRRRPGAVFTITSEREFSNRWMERVEPAVPSLQEEMIRQAQEHVRNGETKVAEATKPLKVELALRKNTGTPGVLLLARNNEADPLPNAAVAVIDIRMWDDRLAKFITKAEIYGDATTFNEMQIGKATLHPSESVQVAFFRSENKRVEINRNGPQSRVDRYALRSHGIWRISCRVKSSDGRFVDQAVCFSWRDGDLFPDPCTCLPYSIGIPSAAPPPHTPVR